MVAAVQLPVTAVPNLHVRVHKLIIGTGALKIAGALIQGRVRGALFMPAPQLIADEVSWPAVMP